MFLVLLSVAVSGALVGCGSKSEKDTAASSTMSTSKEAKSSPNTKTSEKKSAKKAKTEASSKGFSRSRRRSAPEASSSKSQASAGNDGRAGTSGSAASESNKSSQATADTQSDAPVPAGLVGTWTGTSPQATDISFTVDADGNITSRQISMLITNLSSSSTTAKAVQISGNLYVWEGGDFFYLASWDYRTRGAGFQAKPGFILENGTYTPVQFISDLGPTLIIATIMLSHSH